MDFVDCNTCCDWDQLKKIEQTCHVCKGRGVIFNPDKIICNGCGAKMCPPKGDPNWQLPNGLHNAKVFGDYSSTHLFDCTQYVFSLCEFCLRLMFNSFVIPPTVLNEDGDFEMSYEGDKALYDYVQWKQQGGYEQAYLNEKCNTIKNCNNQAKYTLLTSDETYSTFCCCEAHSTTYKTYKHYRLVPFIPNNLKAFV